MQDTPTPTYRCGGSAGLAPRAYFPRDAHLLPDYPFRQNGVRAPGRRKNIRDPTRVQPEATAFVKGR